MIGDEINMSEIIIRQAVSKDINNLSEIDKICFPDPWSKEAFRQEIEENNLAIYLVAEFQEEIIGYIGVWCISWEGHITNIAVKPEWRNKNIASKLIEIMMDLVSKNEVEEFTLEVRPSNLQAINLYNKFGFIEEGRRPKYYQNNGEDAIIMWRRKVN